MDALTDPVSETVPETEPVIELEAVDEPEAD